MKQRRPLKVFVASTSEDLHTHRAAVRDVVLEMGWQPCMMEYMGAKGQRTVAACKDELSQCDLVVLLVAWRRGWVPDVEQGGNGVDSITSLELAFADECGIPVLAFLALDDWPGVHWEHRHIEWIKSFRARIDRPVGFFGWEAPAGGESTWHPAFRSKVRQALTEFSVTQEQRSAHSWVEDFEAALGGLSQGKIVPLVGSGVFGSGPLSRESLARALGDLQDEEQRSLATAAEWREQRLPMREAFLDWFKRLIQEQSAHATDSRMHEILAQMTNVEFIVSATCDLTLENCLREHGRPPAIVTHIIRSLDGEHDGKILVLPSDESAPPRICLADQVDIREWDLVVYKPLGSPMLHERLDPDLEIDTVVVTETDHVELLHRLENQHTAVPTAFSRKLRRYPLLFVGYELDRWHYRLVIHAFQAARGKRVRSLAVRCPASSIERVTWDRLEARQIPLSPHEFADKILECSRG